MVKAIINGTFYLMWHILTSVWFHIQLWKEGEELRDSVANSTFWKLSRVISWKIAELAHLLQFPQRCKQAWFSAQECLYLKSKKRRAFLQGLWYSYWKRKGTALWNFPKALQSFIQNPLDDLHNNSQNTDHNFCFAGRNFGFKNKSIVTKSLKEFFSNHLTSWSYLPEDKSYKKVHIEA